jgi:hypothetical protein
VPVSVTIRVMLSSVMTISVMMTKVQLSRHIGAGRTKHLLWSLASLA